MSRLDGLAARIGGEQRATSTLSNPADWLRTAFGAGSTYSGKSVTPYNVLELVPVLSAVQLISSTLGSLPLNVYEVDDLAAPNPAPASRQWALLHDAPNDELAANELWEIVASHLLTWGNAFVWKERDALGLVTELWPVAPDRVQVGRRVVGGRLQKMFVLDGRDTYTADQFLHVKGLSATGLVGYSPVQLARQMLGSAAAQDEFSGRFWANGAMITGVLQHPNELSDEAAQRLRRTWDAAYKGSSNAGKVAILEEGLEWKPIQMPMRDAEWAASAKLSDLRVAQLFRVPPYMLGAESGDSMTYSNTELQGIDLVRYTLRRWLVRIEEALNTDPSIFPRTSSVGAPRLQCEFQVDALLRADAKTRAETMDIQIANGTLTVNEARLIERRPPIDVVDGASADTTDDQQEDL